MIAGHIGVAAAAKSFDRKLPLWTLLIATFALDIIFPVLMLFGIESMEKMPGTDGGYGKMAFSIDYSHAYMAVIGYSLLCWIITARWWGARGGFILGAVMFSHWVLDLIVHRPDMPLMPGNAGNLPRVGLGLWDVPAAAAIFEALIVIGGVWLYWRSAPKDTPGGRAGASQRSATNALMLLVVGLGVLLLDVFVL
ncbi:MAG TPA: hypothetical protein VNZ58_08320 [Thermomicrobiales bacterium]|nr:hypothetical protein [Thermomicrobiales bacterium]